MLSDLRDAWRSLTRDRAFAALAIFLLSITGGATTAVFAVVNAVLMRPMAFGAPGRTVVIWEHDAARSTPVVEVALGEVETWRERADSLETAAVFTSVNVPVAVLDDGVRTRVSSTWVSAPFFDVVGVPPALGRPLNAADEAGDEPRTAVVSDAFWKQRFGADLGIVGRSIRVQRGPENPPQLLEIVGVMPPAFDFPRGADLWLPAAPALRSIAGSVPGDRADAITWYLAHFKVFYGLGRLREGETPGQAALELGQIVRQQVMPTGTPSDVVITPVVDFLTGPTRPVLWILLGGGVLMLVLACSSVAGLHLFRAARQDRALAIQLALGASRHRLVRHSLFESAILACAATVVGWCVAGSLMRVLVASAPVDVPRLADTSVGDPSVLFLTIGLAALTSALTGVLPACFVSRVHPGRVLTSGARTAMHPRERLIQRIVVGWQITAAVVLLAGAALFVRSVQQLDRTPLGFEASGLLAVELEPSAGDPERWDQFFDAVQERAMALPYVQGAAAIALRPLRGPIGYDSIPVLEGQEGLGPDAPWRKNPRANLQSVTPGFFGTVGARLIAGRDFTRGDVAAAVNVVIVGASTAARFWPGQDPVGARMLVPSQRLPGSLEQPRWQTVVGVVEDVRYRGITDPRLDVYLPAFQSTIRVRDLLVRTTGSAEQTVTDVLRIARESDPGVVVGDVAVLSDLVARETAPWRFAMRLLTGFGALAAVLAAAGLVGLVSLVVTLRRRELAIRAALGATPPRLRAHVLSEAAWIAGIATAAGVGLAALLGRLVTSLLVDTPPHDPASLAGAVIATLLLGIGACLAPAARAAAADPADALRE